MTHPARLLCGASSQRSLVSSQDASAHFQAREPAFSSRTALNGAPLVEQRDYVGVPIAHQPCTEGIAPCSADSDGERSTILLCISLVEWYSRLLLYAGPHVKVLLRGS